MKVTRFKLLALFVSVLVLGFGIVSLIGAEASVEKNAPGEIPGTFTEFMRSLPGDTRVLVESVIEQHLERWENETDESALDYNIWKEGIHRDLKLILTPVQFEAFVKLWGTGSSDSWLSVPASDCISCSQSISKLNQAYGYLDSAESDYKKYKSYCDYGLFPDKVLPQIQKAKARVALAADYAAAAAQSCDYWDALAAQDNADTARIALDYAIYFSTKYCTQYPWMEDLNSASLWLVDLAIPKLDACVNECN